MDLLTMYGSTRDITHIILCNRLPLFSLENFGEPQNEVNPPLSFPSDVHNYYVSIYMYMYKSRATLFPVHLQSAWNVLKKWDRLSNLIHDQQLICKHVYQSTVPKHYN